MSDAIQVWEIPLQVSENVLQVYAQCLSPDEHIRAERFRFSEDRRRFIVSRGALRHLLSGQFECLPQAVEFCYGKYGKPSVDSAGLTTQRTAQNIAGFTIACDRGNGDFNFNISHSGELALCALGNRHRVGIDIEKFKRIQRLDGLLERCLSAQEQADVEATDKPAEAFLRYWTCKEAYLKAIGVGLSQSMKTVEVVINPPRLVCVPDDCEEGWALHTIAVPEGYAGALVVAGNTSVQCNRWMHPNV